MVHKGYIDSSLELKKLSGKRMKGIQELRLHKNLYF